MDKRNKQQPTVGDSFFNELRQFHTRVHQDTLSLRRQSQEIIHGSSSSNNSGTASIRPVGQYLRRQIHNLERHCARIEECTGFSLGVTNENHEVRTTPSLQQLLSTCQMILDENEILLDDCETALMSSSSSARTKSILAANNTSRKGSSDDDDGDDDVKDGHANDNRSSNEDRIDNNNNNNLYSRSAIYETALNQFRNFDFDPMSCNTIAASCYSSFTGCNYNRDPTVTRDNTFVDGNAPMNNHHRSLRFQSYLRNELPIVVTPAGDSLSSYPTSSEQKNKTKTVKTKKKKKRTRQDVNVAESHVQNHATRHHTESVEHEARTPKKRRVSHEGDGDERGDDATIMMTPPHRIVTGTQSMTTMMSTPTLSTMGLSETALQTIGYYDNEKEDDESEEEEEDEVDRLRRIAQNRGVLHDKPLNLPLTRTSSSSSSTADLDISGVQLLERSRPVFRRAQDTSMDETFRLTSVSTSEMDDLPLYLQKQIISLEEFNRCIQTLNESRDTIHINQSTLMRLFEGMSPNTARNFILVLLKLGKFKGTARNEDNELVYLVK